MTLASSKNFATLVAIRFFVGRACFYRKGGSNADVLSLGLAESSFYPAMQYVTGSWYKPDELGKRACIFHVRIVPWCYS